MVAVSESTIRQDVFNRVFTVVKNGKPTGWVVRASHPDIDGSFPCIVVDPARVEVKNIAFGVSPTKQFRISFKIFVYALRKPGSVSQGYSKVDEGADNVSASLYAALDSLMEDGISLMSVSDSDTGFVDALDANYKVMSVVFDR